MTSRIDMKNCLYLGLPDTQIHKLQCLQNAAAMIMMWLPKHFHITETLYELHWLPVSWEIQYKVLLTVYKARHNRAPEYLTHLLIWKQTATRCMCLNNWDLLVVPRSHSVIYGNRTFSNVAPSLCNNVSHQLWYCENINTFKGLLKTHLFKFAYDLL